MYFVPLAPKSTPDEQLLLPLTKFWERNFKAVGDQRLDMVCVHAFDRVIIESLSD